MEMFFNDMLDKISGVVNNHMNKAAEWADSTGLKDPNILIRIERLRHKRRRFIYYYSFDADDLILYKDANIDIEILNYGHKKEFPGIIRRRHINRIQRDKRKYDIIIDRVQSHETEFYLVVQPVGARSEAILWRRLEKGENIMKHIDAMINKTVFKMARSGNMANAY